jgi:PAS domain-containing protein
MMILNRLKWGAAIVLVFIGIMIFNQFVFGLIDKAQRATAEQTRYLNLLIESSGNAIITTSRDGRILSWNRAAEDIDGWPKAHPVMLTASPIRDEAGA